MHMVTYRRHFERLQGSSSTQASYRWARSQILGLPRLVPTASEHSPTVLPMPFHRKIKPLYRIIYVIFQEWFLDFNTKMTTLIFDEDEVELVGKSEVK